MSSRSRNTTTKLLRLITSHASSPPEVCQSPFFSSRAPEFPMFAMWGDRRISPPDVFVLDLLLILTTWPRETFAGLEDFTKTRPGVYDVSYVSDWRPTRSHTHGARAQRAPVSRAYGKADRRQNKFMTEGKAAPCKDTRGGLLAVLFFSGRNHA